jgi:hypothetical protein
MFISDEWNAFVYNTKVDGQAIAQLVRHIRVFGWECRSCVPLGNFW